jgi:hypothetical protein
MKLVKIVTLLFEKLREGASSQTHQSCWGPLWAMSVEKSLMFSTLLRLYLSFGHRTKHLGGQEYGPALPSL